jgi:predicted amidohydrolase YtcJ
MMKKSMPVFIVLTVMMIAGCIKKEKADLILLNGRVYTVDSVFSVKQAFAVTEGVFLAVGSNDEILASFDADLIVDAGGKTVFPGLIDGHCHFFGYAVHRFQGVNLRGTRSFDEILELLKEFNAGKPGQWITGTGWDQNDWENNEFPDNSMLDELFPDIPGGADKN